MGEIIAGGRRRCRNVRALLRIVLSRFVEHGRLLCSASYCREQIRLRSKQSFHFTPSITADQSQTVKLQPRRQMLSATSNSEHRMQNPIKSEFSSGPKRQPKEGEEKEEEEADR